MSTPDSAVTATPGWALITGPTVGIGRVFADRLAARGHNLILVSRDEASLTAVAEEIRKEYAVTVDVLPADLTDRADQERVEARVGSTENPVDVLVNNAGFGLKGRFDKNPIADEQAHLDVLVTAPMRLMHAALGQMVTRGSGSIINVASVAGYLPRGSYSAAKAYVIKLSEWAHAEYAPKGVRVMVLCPGFVRTEFHQRMGVGTGSAPEWMWLTAERLVDDSLRDLDAGKSVSVPSYLYKGIVGAATLIPTRALQRFQSLGRK